MGWLFCRDAHGLPARTAKSAEPRKATCKRSGGRKGEEEVGVRLAETGNPPSQPASPTPDCLGSVPLRPHFECCALSPSLPARPVAAQPYPARFAVCGRANGAPPLGRTIETQAPAGAAESSGSLRTPGCRLLSERLLALAG